VELIEPFGVCLRQRLVLVSADLVDDGFINRADGGRPAFAADQCHLADDFAPMISVFEMHECA
jgi:hypothetical protein